MTSNSSAGLDAERNYVAARAHGLRTLIRHLIRTVARLVHTGRRRLDFAKSNFRLDWLLYATRQLE